MDAKWDEIGPPNRSPYHRGGPRAVDGVKQLRGPLSNTFVSEAIRHDWPTASSLLVWSSILLFLNRRLLLVKTLGTCTLIELIWALFREPQAIQQVSRKPFTRVSQRAPNPTPILHSPPFEQGQSAVVPSEGVQIWVCLFLYGW